MVKDHHSFTSSGLFLNPFLWYFHVNETLTSPHFQLYIYIYHFDTGSVPHLARESPPPPPPWPTFSNISHNPPLPPPTFFMFFIQSPCASVYTLKIPRSRISQPLTMYDVPYILAVAPKNIHSLSDSGLHVSNNWSLRCQLCLKTIDNTLCVGT